MKDGALEGLETAPRVPASLAKAQLALATAATAPAAQHLPHQKMAAINEKKNEARIWNTKNLSMRLGVDTIAAASAAVLVAPLISVIDRYVHPHQYLSQTYSAPSRLTPTFPSSIMENASGRRSLGVSLRSSLRDLLLRPQNLLFSKPCALIFMVYGGTYLTANYLDTATSTVQNKPATHVTSGTAKFASSSAANIGLCIYKDQVFVRLFGAGSPRPVSMPSYLLFGARDCLTIFASFNLPPLLGPVFSKHASQEIQKYATGQTMAQFAAPAAIQVLSTPVHLLGLDMYNRPGLGWLERWNAVKKNWTVSTLARICRIVPAFGVGGVVNVKVRKGLMEKLV